MEFDLVLKGSIEESGFGRGSIIGKGESLG